MTERPTDPKPLASMKPRTVVMHKRAVNIERWGDPS